MSMTPLVLQMDGDLYKIYSDWSSRLTHLLAKIEAFVDFGDSGDVEDRSGHYNSILFC